MKINIESIPHDQHRYPTVGDYWRDADGTLQIRVSAMSDERHEFLVALHEMIEVALTEHRRIAEQTIKAFDEAHLDSDDPGSLPEAPYHQEHMFADAIERLAALELDVSIPAYEAALRKLDE